MQTRLAAWRTKRQPTRLSFRYELVQNALSAGVSVNHYDKSGNTVLMSFVMHMVDGEDNKILETLFHDLFRMANLQWRNRQGETALHIVARSAPSSVIP